MAETTESIPAPVSVKPAPWNTQCETYWLMLYMPAVLPEGLYDPLEASSPHFADPNLSGEFKGGLAIIMVVRYKDTPTGPYDELLLIPGAFRAPTSSTPVSHRTLNRIARIYVSQRDTCYNGRANWNIPKHLARFSFSSPPVSATSPTPKSLTLAVYPPDPTSTIPFFSATLTPFTWLPAIPFSTRYMPLSAELGQPPLPAAPRASKVHSPLSNSNKAKDPYDITKDEAELLVGTERWCSMTNHAYSPKTRGMWVEVHSPAEEDAKKEAQRWWPQGIKPWKIGAWMEEAEIEIPAPKEWKL
ncbi:hypothetical protein BU16DRAFT_464911 [Lophium mytilinum]|uniref:Acetoacetate decarboxylase n=1 Tax=Lophium mytilinum TaxID=390894 RepID=A0A6A6QN22_9PEZI|nr:hypothetical protein BU16DRAFT_464911 [Lophium mytilinum]